VAIMINDLSRSTPSKVILPPLLETLEREGIPAGSISIVIATGTHRDLSDREVEGLLGKDIPSRYFVTSHDCRASDLARAGTLSTDNVLLLNSLVYHADIRISIGEILFHYFAGYAGGRKSLCPGVAGWDTIMRNHSLMTHPKAALGNLKGNPVHLELIEALHFCPLDFIINVICNEKKELVSVVTGDPIKAWEEGLKIFRAMNTVNLEDRSRVVIASSGGFPKDINIYQAQKAFEMAGRAVSDGGSLVVFAECPEQYGSETFREWAETGMTAEAVIERFEKGFQLGAHKLYYLARMSRRINLFLVSSLSEEVSAKIFCRKIHNWDEGLQVLEVIHGRDFSPLVIPQAGMVLPEIKTS